MSYTTPLPLLLTGVEAFLKELVDADGNRLIYDAQALPREVPMSSQRPYALFGLDIFSNRGGDVETTLVVNLYLDAVDGREGYLDALELGTLVGLSLQQAMERGELAEGVYGGTMRVGDFVVRYKQADPEAEPLPDCFVIQLRLTPQFQEE